MSNPNRCKHMPWMIVEKKQITIIVPLKVLRRTLSKAEIESLINELFVLVIGRIRSLL